MRLVSSIVLIGFVAACATGEEPEGMLTDGSSGSSGSSSSAGTSPTGGNPPGTSGGGSGGSSSTAGAFGMAGGTPIVGGTFSTGGQPTGTSGGGTGGAATAGSGGATAGSGGAMGGMGGKASGGAGGTGTAGKAGAGGTSGTAGGPATGCPAKTTWEATASVHADDCTDMTSAYCGPPARAVDGITNNRFTTGTARVGDEWLQIDFKEDVTVTQVTLTTAAGSGDYTLAYEARMSSNANDIATSAVIVSGTGQQGTTTITFPAAKTGRYLRIDQTMAMAGWWSVAEVNVECQ